jgi:hypothetical protein
MDRNQHYDGDNQARQRPGLPFPVRHPFCDKQAYHTDHSPENLLLEKVCFIIVDLYGKRVRGVEDHDDAKRKQNERDDKKYPVHRILSIHITLRSARAGGF